jgi:aspartyl-tRNA(Asn)/glutamyl-tRNA(Gln) amidotransferase subunit B
MSRAPEWETVVGLEVHVQLDTRSKLFVDAPPAFAPDAPNTFVTPYCLGLPGTLPRVDGEAVRKAIRTALALGFTVHASSRFARKHYFYPDLPKGYQITQANEPLATGGRLEVPGFDSALRLTRLHLEEDAGKAVSEGPQQIGLDYNRAGVPLVEIVSEPDLRSGEAAAAALRELRAIVRALGVSDGSLERAACAATSTSRCVAGVTPSRAYGAR